MSDSPRRRDQSRWRSILKPAKCGHMCDFWESGCCFCAKNGLYTELYKAGEFCSACQYRLGLLLKEIV